MNQFAHPTPKCQAAPAPFGCLDLWLDVEVLAERYEALAALEYEPEENTDDAEEEPSDDLPF